MPHPELRRLAILPLPRAPLPSGMPDSPACAKPQHIATTANPAAEQYVIVIHLQRASPRRIQRPLSRTCRDTGLPGSLVRLRLACRPDWGGKDCKSCTNEKLRLRTPSKWGVAAWICAVVQSLRLPNTKEVAIDRLSRGYRETSSCRAAPTPPTARRPLLLWSDSLGAAHAKNRPPRRALCSAQVAFFLFAALRAVQLSSRTPPAAACAPAAADWGLGDLRAVAGDVFRMILPLLALQGAR
jgi:hypothetical protein